VYVCVCVRVCQCTHTRLQRNSHKLLIRSSYTHPFIRSSYTSFQIALDTHHCTDWQTTCAHLTSHRPLFTTQPACDITPHPPTHPHTRVSLQANTSFCDCTANARAPDPTLCSICKQPLNNPTPHVRQQANFCFDLTMHAHLISHRPPYAGCLIAACRARGRTIEFIDTHTHRGAHQCTRS